MIEEKFDYNCEGCGKLVKRLEVKLARGLVSMEICMNLGCEYSTVIQIFGMSKGESYEGIGVPLLETVDLDKYYGVDWDKEEK